MQHDLDAPKRLLKLIFVFLVGVQLTGQNAAFNLQESKRQLERVKTGNSDVQQSYVDCKSDGLEVTVLRLNKDQLAAVNPDTTFNSGDRIKIRLQSNFDGYVYVVNTTPGGERRLLFPQSLSRTNNALTGRRYDIPSSRYFRFDDEPGLEVLLVIISRMQVPVLETTLDHAPIKGNVVLSLSAVALIDRLTRQTRGNGTSGISTRDTITTEAGLRTRMLKLESRKEGSIIIVAPTTKANTNRFGPGEIAVFEIRLNHR